MNVVQAGVADGAPTSAGVLVAPPACVHHATTLHYKYNSDIKSQNPKTNINNEIDLVQACQTVQTPLRGSWWRQRPLYHVP